MIHTILHPFRKYPWGRHAPAAARRGWLLLVATAWLAGGCSHLLPSPPVSDPAAEAIVSQLRQTNVGLTQFKMVGRLSLARPHRPDLIYRAAIAGQQENRLRIDLFSPVGGSAGSLSSDGNQLFVINHASREYHKKALGNGSLRQFVGLDISVEDLLEFMFGRIPLASDCVARLTPMEAEAQQQLTLVDRRGRVCQRITLNKTLQPVRAVWFDTSGKAVYTLTASGLQVVDGFTLPRQMVLSATTGQRLSVNLDRFMANASISDGLFTLPPPPS